jgi:hypothetical protein
MFTGIWWHPTLPSFEPLATGPKPVTKGIDHSYAILPGLTIITKTEFVQGLTSPCLMWSSP